MPIDATVIVAGVSVVGMAVAAIPTVADALDRRARRNAGIDLMDQAQKFDFARDTIAGREASAWDER
ncbi:hypothetical protein [Methanofollis tationis]|uniref:Uncharacterized protein n=1 Tax=Methanofollis tationis TaxID=81417 RepID=A0A7K4HSB7_9EURY|nr:hypothetical protein [Methanofollis tationis]NVO67947.1 hypothetical protein [Methanofollis tationis]